MSPLKVVLRGLVGDCGKEFLMSSGGVLSVFVRATPFLFLAVLAGEK